MKWKVSFWGEVKHKSATTWIKMSWSREENQQNKDTESRNQTQDTLVHNECQSLLYQVCFLILLCLFCFRNTRSTTVHHQKQRPVLTQRIPQVNTSSNFVTDSSSEGENRVLRLGKCKLNNEFFSKESSAELYKSSYFRPGPKIPFSFSRSTSIPTMLNGASDLIAIGTIPMASQRQTPPKPMSR